MPAIRRAMTGVDGIVFDEASLRRLTDLPAAAHREYLAVDVLRAAWRRRWLILACGLVAAGLAAGAAAIMAPRYTSEAIIELQVSRAAPLGAGEAPASVVVEAASIVLGEARILRSPVIARQAVEKLGLADDPAYGGAGWLDAANRIVSRWLDRPASLDRPADAPSSKTHAERAAAAERALSRGLTIETDNRSYLISVTAAAADPVLAARIANTVAEEYLDRRLTAHLEMTGRTADWLNGQLATTETQLQAADAAVAAFREQSGLADLGGPGESLRQRELREYAAQLNTLSLARIADEARLTRIEALAQAGPSEATAELQTVPAVQSAIRRRATQRDALSDMQTQLGPRHPDVIRAQASLDAADAALATEVDRAVIGLRGQLAANRAAEARLRTQVEALERSLIADIGQQNKLQGFQAAAAVLRERLDSLRRSRDQAMALRALRVVPASVIVQAQANPQPVGISPVIAGLGALLAGLGVGAGLALLLEQADRGLRTSDDVMSTAMLRCLSLVPELPGPDASPSAVASHEAAVTQVMFDEAVRLVASGVGLFGKGSDGPGRVVLVTSSLPGEGRSTLCAGLAHALVASGRRVLLVDGAPRRFDPPAPPPPPDRRPAAETGPPATDTPLQTTVGADGPALVLLKRNSDAALSLDVFSSAKLSAALEHAQRHFDVILIEGPPIMLAADSLVLGRIADTVIFAARWADTRRSAIRTALARMRDHGVVVDGVVLTRVDTRKHARMGLGDLGSYHLRRHGYYARGAAPSAADVKPVYRA